MTIKDAVPTPNTALAPPRLSATPRSGLRWRTPASFDHLIRAQQNRWGYALALDWRRAIYWFASAVLTAAVTF